jgi:hypothetical protein
VVIAIVPSVPIWRNVATAGVFGEFVFGNPAQSPKKVVGGVVGGGDGHVAAVHKGAA